MVQLRACAPRTAQRVTSRPRRGSARSSSKVRCCPHSAPPGFAAVSLQRPPSPRCPHRAKSRLTSPLVLKAWHLRVLPLLPSLLQRQSHLPSASVSGPLLRPPRYPRRPKGLWPTNCVLPWRSARLLQPNRPQTGKPRPRPPDRRNWQLVPVKQRSRLPTPSARRRPRPCGLPRSRLPMTSCRLSRRHMWMLRLHGRRSVHKTGRSRAA